MCLGGTSLTAWVDKDGVGCEQRGEGQAAFSFAVEVGLDFWEKEQFLWGLATILPAEKS